MKTGLFAVTVLVTALGSSTPTTAATSYCVEPRAPTLYAVKPSKPFCAAMRNCNDLDISSYRRKVASYFADLEAYAADVDRFHKRAGEYIECMSDLD